MLCIYLDVYRMEAHPFDDKFWAWYHDADMMGWDVACFAVERTVPYAEFCFAGKVMIGGVIMEYLSNATSTNWTAMTVSPLGICDRVSEFLIV